MSEAKGPGATPYCVRQAAGRTQHCHSEKEATIYGELTSGCLISYQGNQQLGQGANTKAVTD